MNYGLLIKFIFKQLTEILEIKLDTTQETKTLSDKDSLQFKKGPQTLLLLKCDLEWKISVLSFLPSSEIHADFFSALISKKARAYFSITFGGLGS